MSDEEQAVLTWTCLGCGWRHNVPMPGYAGDGYIHEDPAGVICGPLVAVRQPGFTRASPGAEIPQPFEVAA